MLRTFWLYAIALAVFIAAPMQLKAAGHNDFVLSTYACSDVYWGGVKVGDNCVATDEEKMEVLNSIRDDDDNDDS